MTTPADDVRDQLLHAIDFNYAAGLGYGTPEDLLAAYDASRTPLPADRAAVRAEAFRDAAKGAYLNVHSAAAEGVRRWLLALADAERRRMADETATGQPAALTEPERKMLDYALDQAQEHIWSRDGFTDEDQGAVDSLRRLTADQPAAGARQDGAQPLAAADNPTPLRWGLDDVLHGDDDTTTVLLSGPSGTPYWLKLEPERAAALRDALTGPGGESTETQPRRGDAFEQWLKARRDEHRDTGRGVWTTLDDLLDTYRLHADMGVPLDGHVCEARVVGDCECLEQPVTGARDGAVS